MKKLGITIEGDRAARISKLFRVPVTARYEWPDFHKSAVIQGIVVGPERFFASDSTRITAKTREVILENVRRTEVTDGTVVTINENSWAVHTPLVTLSF